MFVAIAIALVALCTPDALAQVPTTPTTVPISKVEYCYYPHGPDGCTGAVDKTSCAAWVAYQSPRVNGRTSKVTVTDNCAATGCWSFQTKSGPDRMWMYAASCGECKAWGTAGGVPPAVYQT